MSVGLIGKKVGMTQVFDDTGLPIPVTVIELGDNIVVRQLTPEKNGYSALQVGGFVVYDDKLNGPELGQFKKAALPALSPLVEFRTDNNGKHDGDYKVGDSLIGSLVIEEGMLVDVRGRSIGKGFQGRIKRWNGRRGRMTHGSKHHRGQGSIGQHSDPGRVFKGLKMAGQMGNENSCARHLAVVRIDTDKRILLVRGSVPGAKGGLLTITPSKAKWN